MKVCRGLWQAPPPALRESPAGLELPLLPSPRLRQALRLLGCLAVLHAAELFRHGHPLAAFLMLAGTGGALWAWRLSGRLWPARPRRLVLAADGQIYLQLYGGAVEPATLGGASLRLGRRLLLVLQCRKRRYRLLLGPDNLAPAELAALQRRLPFGAGG